MPAGEVWGVEPREDGWAVQREEPIAPTALHASSDTRG
jgi:hypothetical protein